MHKFKSFPVSKNILALFLFSILKCTYSRSIHEGNILGGAEGRKDSMDSIKDDMVKIVNCYRSCHSASPLTRDTQIEESQSTPWAEKIGASGGLQHSDSRYGENLYAGPLASGADAVNLWYFECQGSYNYNDNSGGSGQCGHFTQLCWKSSSTISFGIAEMKSYGYVVVANFNPPGNYGGQYTQNVLSPDASCVNSCKQGSGIGSSNGPGPGDSFGGGNNNGNMSGGDNFGNGGNNDGNMSGGNGFGNGDNNNGNMSGGNYFGSGGNNFGSGGDGNMGGGNYFGGGNNFGNGGNNNGNMSGGNGFANGGDGNMGGGNYFGNGGNNNGNMSGGNYFGSGGDGNMSGGNYFGNGNNFGSGGSQYGNSNTGSNYGNNNDSGYGNAGYNFGNNGHNENGGHNFGNHHPIPN